jgi:hypothetical protein
MLTDTGYYGYYVAVLVHSGAQHTVISNNTLSCIHHWKTSYTLAYIFLIFLLDWEMKSSQGYRVHTGIQEGEV